MSEYPVESPPPSPAARPATAGGEEFSTRTYAAPAAASEPQYNGFRWAPLLSRTPFVVALVVGGVVGIAGPILLWLNFTYAGNGTPFYQRLGYVLVLIGLGLLVIALPFLLGEAARLERTSAPGSAVGSPEGARALTGTRIFALLAVVVLLAGVFLVRPVEAAATNGGTGSSQGGGGGGGNGGGGGGGGG